MPLTLGTYIRVRRQDLGLTQEALASRAGALTHPADISRLENNRVLHLSEIDRQMAALLRALSVLTDTNGSGGTPQAD